MGGGGGGGGQCPLRPPGLAARSVRQCTEKKAATEPLLAAAAGEGAALAQLVPRGREKDPVVIVIAVLVVVAVLARLRRLLFFVLVVLCVTLLQAFQDLSPGDDGLSLALPDMDPAQTAYCKFSTIIIPHRVRRATAGG
jgi:hypothetical protein